MLPVIEAKRAEIVKNDHQIGDHVRLLPTPGHTPGHLAFCFGKGSDEAVVSGDLMHSPLQARYPELSVNFDVDKVAVGQNPPQLPRALLRHEDAVLHGALPVPVRGTDQALGRRVQVRDGVAVIPGRRAAPSPESIPPVIVSGQDVCRTSVCDSD